MPYFNHMRKQNENKNFESFGACDSSNATEFNNGLTTTDWKGGADMMP
jgi:hypothetical protein